jgi:hypothetical protein
MRAALIEMGGQQIENDASGKSSERRSKDRAHASSNNSGGKSIQLRRRSQGSGTARQARDIGIAGNGARVEGRSNGVKGTRRLARLRGNVETT